MARSSPITQEKIDVHRHRELGRGSKSAPRRVVGGPELFKSLIQPFRTPFERRLGRQGEFCGRLRDVIARGEQLLSFGGILPGLADLCHYIRPSGMSPACGGRKIRASKKRL